jgi:hypothetical protein
LKLLRASLAATFFASLFVACSPSDGDGGGSGDGTGGGGSPSGGAANGGSTSTGGAETGGASGTSTTGGASGAGVGGSAGSTTGGASTGGASTGGASGASGSSGAPAGGTGGAGGSQGGTSGASGASGSAGSGPGGSGGTNGGAYTGTVIVEDDFDAQANMAAPDSAKWQLYPDYSQPQQPIVDSTRSHSAPNSAKARGNPSFLIPKQGAVLGGMIAPGNKFYVRFWVNFEKTTAMVGNHSTFLVGAVAKDNSGTELRLGFSSNQNGKPEMLDVNLQNPSDGGEVTRYSNGFTDGGNSADFPGMGVQFDANKWYCLEALFDGAGSEFRLWIDGTENMDMHVHDFSANATPRTAWGPMFNYLKIGTQDYSGQIGQVWYDDVFVGTAPIGCAR